jgi:hypothetical protein
MSNITQYSVQRRAMMLGLICWPGLVGGGGGGGGCNSHEAKLSEARFQLPRLK